MQSDMFIHQLVREFTNSSLLISDYTIQINPSNPVTDTDLGPLSVKAWAQQRSELVVSELGWLGFWSPPPYKMSHSELLAPYVEYSWLERVSDVSGHIGGMIRRDRNNIGNYVHSFGDTVKESSNTPWRWLALIRCSVYCSRTQPRMVVVGSRLLI